MRHFFRRATAPFVPLALLLPLLFTACSQEPESETAGASQDSPAAADCRLVMGWDSWPPYQYRNPQGEVAGLDIDIARAAAAAGGCEIDFVDGNWMDMLNRLRDGDVDLLAGATPTPGREEFAVFTEPYRSESFAVFTLADNAQIRATETLAELFDSEARIGTVAEYYYGEEIYALMDVAAAAGRLREVEVSEDNYQDLLNGEIDAFLDDPFVASSILRSRGWGERIVATGLNTATGQVSFMLSRQSVTPQVIQRFGDGMNRIRENGELAAILEEYRK
ncbi:MAG TPA: transporter substrate-binding domain-containing protein [Gammaproteobacteria bacterium]